MCGLLLLVVGWCSMFVAFRRSSLDMFCLFVVCGVLSVVSCLLLVVFVWRLLLLVVDRR